MTILGTRPEIIRLSVIIPLLDSLCDHVVVHTGQNFDDRLSGLFFRELGLRAPNIFLGVNGLSFAQQVAQIISGIEPVLRAEKPDRVLILGDTNTSLSAIVARRSGIPVYHLEAGNRCRDFRVPEEINRRIVDHISNVLLPYTESSRKNLLQEGIAAENIHVIGNPIKEVMDVYWRKILDSKVLSDLNIPERKFFLVTLHRAENVDDASRLRGFLGSLESLHQLYKFPVICSLHPRTRSRIAEFGVDLSQSGIRFLEPLGFFDFINLERAAFCVLTDSGTVQEETCILKVPNVTLRDVTERPETIECGSNVLAACNSEEILALVRKVTQTIPSWTPPPEYLVSNVSSIVARIVLENRSAAAVQSSFASHAAKSQPA